MISAVPSVSSVHVELDGRLPSTAGRTDETTKLSTGFPPRDGKGLMDFCHNWTNSISQQLKKNFWKIVETLFRISPMTNSFKYSQWSVST
jgi:hypothetical protein